MADNGLSYESTPTTLSVGEDAVPMVSNREQTIGFIHRSHLDELVDEWNLTKDAREFPSTYTELRDRAADAPGSDYMYRENENSGFGVERQHVEAAVRELAGSGGYDPSKYSFYYPVQHETPFVIVSDRVPDEYLIQVALGSREEFIEQAGGTACIECEEIWSEKQIYCPECGEYATAVDSSLDALRSEHPGVLAVLAPRIDTDPGSSDESPDVDTVLDQYREMTGDTHLVNEDALDSFLETRGIIEPTEP